jgi:hypothetical protein
MPCRDPLLVLVPTLPGIAALVGLTGRGPVLYLPEREERDGDAPHRRASGTTRPATTRC